MKKKTKLRFPEFLFAVLCLCVFAGSLYMFWKELNSTSSRSDKDSVAVIEFKRRLAQRKFSDRVVWERLQQKSTLYNADTIRTADDSDATIYFNDGTTLDIHENTMLQIFYSDGGVNINISGGNVDVDTTDSGKKVSVSLGDGSVVHLDTGSRLTANAADDGSANFQLKDGNALIQTKNGEQASIVQGEGIELSEDGGLKHHSISVTSIKRDEKLITYDEETIPVVIKWNVADDYKNEKIILETSYSQKFDKIEQSFERTGADSVTVDSSKGKLYWRVYPAKEKEDPVRGRISVASLSPVVPVSPAQKAVFAYRNEYDLPRIMFTWTGNEYAVNYKIEISPDSNFSSFAVQDVVNEPQYVCKSLAEGTYFWRVTPYYKIIDEGYSEPSDALSFKVSLNSDLQPPVLLVPYAKAKIPSYSKDSELAFMWKSAVKKADFKLELSATEDFSEILWASETTNSTRMTMPYNHSNLPDGKYYWRVTRSSAEDLNPVTSEPLSFDVALYIPGETKLVYPPVNYSVEQAKVSNVGFTWKLADEFIGKDTVSVFQISPVPDFSRNVTEIKTENCEIRNINVPSGKNYWRIGVENPKTSLAESFTPYRAINVLGRLEAPKINKPAASQLITVNGSNSVTFAWSEVKGADYYKLKVLDAESERVLCEVPSTKKTESLLVIPSDSFAAVGKKKSLKCTVQAFSDETEVSALRIGPVSECAFEVRQPLPLKLLSPLNGVKINGLNALHQPVVLSWSSEEKINNAELVLKKRLSNGSYKTVERFSNAKKQVSLKRLAPGTYKWSVSSVFTDGVVIEPEENGSFVVTEVPPLSKPVQTLPAASSVLGTEYFKSNKNLIFKWNAVSGATDYNFVLYQKLSGGGLKKVFERNKVRDTEIKLRDLKILANGEFQWQVTAYAHARDNFEEQRSPETSSVFTIEITKPGKVQTIEPGRQYGE